MANGVRNLFNWCEPLRKDTVEREETGLVDLTLTENKNVFLDFLLVSV